MAIIIKTSSLSVAYVSIERLFFYYSLNMPLAYRVLTYIWKRMRSVGQGFGGSGAGAPLRRRVESGLGLQKRLVKLTFRSQNCKRTESGAIMGNPAFSGLQKSMKIFGF